MGGTRFGMAVAVTFPGDFREAEFCYTIKFRMASRARAGLYRGGDARLLPAYSFADASRYLRIPAQTLRNWAVGDGAHAAVFHIDDPAEEFLSFMNLVEAHILSGIRKHYGVQLPMVRKALLYVENSFAVRRPLIDESFQTDGRHLFVEKYGELINASRGGQTAMSALLSAQLERIDRDKIGMPIRLYPFTRANEAGADRAAQPKLVVINPRVSFGRPSVGGVPTSAIWSRYRAGDSSAHLSKDYGLSLEQIDEAIRCEAA